MLLRRISQNGLFLLSSLQRRLCTSRLEQSIEELNKEMEAIFGEPPTSGESVLSGSSSSITSQPASSGFNDPLTILSHVSSSGEAQMVDVSAKEDTKRTATASCRVLLGEEVFRLVAANQMAKGDVLSIAKIAGINGAKQTSHLIPLCHNIPLTYVSVDLKLNKNDFSVEIEGEASLIGKTGVEMEAMTAVAVAGLTVYDMCKAASKRIQITDIQLERKIGGKSGNWRR